MVLKSWIDSGAVQTQFPKSSIDVDGVPSWVNLLFVVDGVPSSSQAPEMQEEEGNFWVMSISQFLFAVVTNSSAWRYDYPGHGTRIMLRERNNY